jgi:hypothetical protein
VEELFELLCFWIDLGLPDHPDASMWRKVIFLYAPLGVMLGMGIVALFHVVMRAR